MPNLGRAIIRMDNFEKPGQETRAAVFAELQARGINPQFAKPIYDPSSGKLIQVSLENFDLDNTVAVDAINKLPGVSEVPTTPKILFMRDLEGIDFEEKQGGGETGNMQVLYVSEDLGDSCAEEAGTKTGVSTIAAGSDQIKYVDGVVNPGCVGTLVIINIQPFGSGLQYVTGDWALFFDGGSLPIQLTEPVVIDDNLTEEYGLYIDMQGNAYVAFHSVGGITVIPDRDYADAVAAGAL